MTSTTSGLLADIEAFMVRTSMTATTFGLRAVNDGKFVSELRKGRRCWPETAEKARAFMAEGLRPGAAGHPEGVSVAA